MRLYCDAFVFRTFRIRMKIDTAAQEDYAELLEVWEASVRATHHFLAERDLLELRPLLLDQYFPAVDLTVVRANTGEAVGFCGVCKDNIEMLFVAPEHRGQGIGTMLALHAIAEKGATKVDVNEQNRQALGFYERLGFCVAGRSPLDGQGKPYPILHLVLEGSSIAEADATALFATP